MSYSQVDPQEFQIYGLLHEEYGNINNIQPTFCPANYRLKEDRKNTSAYALFFKENQGRVRMLYPEASFGEISKIVAFQWESMGSYHKKMYRDRVKDERKQKLLAKAMEKAMKLCQK
ncbi:unnamed protein product [Bursaphelenchus okinawaensis]|uniref:HMG box domain-containing protein n=1 Tax=Bursaphelenchus okinawaensis TaxID=465554 RepID=A0A811JU59_9BILA|nr:unnamed protein product [Bursaphelenchus okinawaensis]CAG9083348.1 unnamed protein product [Bursaphelenchus okinawaensis]